MPELDDFYDYIWGLDNGFPCYVYMAIKEPTGRWRTLMFRWPEQRKIIIERTVKYSALDGCDVYYSPALYHTPRPLKENVQGSWFLWVDLDGNAPKDWDTDPRCVGVPKPSLVIQSSIEGHQHLYWKMHKFIDDVVLLDRSNRRLAYALQADTSGWDADQVLRPPFTTNHKRGVPVTIKSGALI